MEDIILLIIILNIAVLNESFNISHLLAALFLSVLFMLMRG